MMHKHPDYEDLIGNLEQQATSFRASDEPPKEFARRVVGQCEEFLNKVQKAGQKRRG